MGNLLYVGDLVFGYMFLGINFNFFVLDVIENFCVFGLMILDVILVKKYYFNRCKNRKCNWKFKCMVKDEGELLFKVVD